MTTTKVFTSGNSQAVRIPQELKLDSKDVVIHKIGYSIIITPKNKLWENFMTVLNASNADFPEDIHDKTLPKERNFDLI